MAWSASFLAALAASTMAPSFRLRRLADTLGRSSSASFGQLPGSVADADLVVDVDPPVLGGDGLDLPGATATSGDWGLRFSAVNPNRLLQAHKPGAIFQLYMDLGGYEEPIAIGALSSLTHEDGQLSASFTGVGDVLRSRWAASPQRLFGYDRPSTNLGAAYTAGDTTVTVDTTVAWVADDASSEYYLRVTPKSGEPFILRATGRTATTFTGVSTSGRLGTTAADARNGATVEYFQATTLGANYTPGDTAVAVVKTSPWADRDTMALYGFRVYPTTGEPFILSGTARTGTTFTSVGTSGRRETDAVAAVTGDDVEPLIFFRRNPVDIVLRVLTSTGLGTNGASDLYPAAWGLAIPEACVDLATSALVKGAGYTLPSSGDRVLEVLVEVGDEGVEDALAWMESLLSPWGIILCQRQGQICLRALFDPIAPFGAGPVTVIDETVLAQADGVAWSYPGKEQGVYDVVRWKTLTRPRSSQLGTPSALRPGLGVAVVDVSDQLFANLTAVLDEVAARVSDYYLRGFAEVQLSLCGWAAWALCPGDRVRVSVPDTPFIADATGRTTFQNRQGVIVQVDADPSSPETAITVYIYDE